MNYVVICCVCNKIRENIEGKDNWDYHNFDSSLPLSHTYCPSCTLDAIKEIQQMRARRNKSSLTSVD